jgi:hypothetical protein
MEVGLVHHNIHFWLTMNSPLLGRDPTRVMRMTKLRKWRERAKLE